jgi:hypothetical protein
MDVILYQFHTILHPLFHKFNNKPNKNGKPRSRMRNGGKGKRKRGANGNNKEQQNGKKKLAQRITNNNQVKEFKMAKDKTWEGTFQGKCPESQVKWMGAFMCPCYHTKGNAGTRAANTARCTFRRQRLHKKRRGSIWTI